MEDECKISSFFHIIILSKRRVTSFTNWHASQLPVLPHGLSCKQKVKLSVPRVAGIILVHVSGEHPDVVEGSGAHGRLCPATFFCWPGKKENSNRKMLSFHMLVLRSAGIWLAQMKYCSSLHEQWAPKRVSCHYLHFIKVVQTMSACLLPLWAEMCWFHSTHMHKG